MRLDLFFKGMQNKETTASAWLATLLRDDRAFRMAFLDQLRLDPPLDADSPWDVRIETPLGSGFCDVTLESADAYVLIESKVSSSAVTPGQFLAYYRGAMTDPARVTKRIVGVYLGPRQDSGSGEVGSVETAPEHGARRASTGDAVRILGWQPDMEHVVAASTRPGEWFARAGFEAIVAHIARLRDGRPFEQQRGPRRPAAERRRTGSHEME